MSALAQDIIKFELNERRISSCSQMSFFTTVASLCYKSSASDTRVVLDGFLTYQSSTTSCGCTLTSSESTNVKFTALAANLQPNHQGCNNNIRVQSGGTIFLISCYISGNIMVSPSQPATLNFEKPPFGYDSGYCMLLNTGKQMKEKKI